ncbi:hypothetical protein SynBIOSE41_02462 [Synechococcus sp. BIOS-E4-1]|uniref:hypothetical protein n=1 Tax=Synechococcus sp. BIOS-E4-1 TaxID=1400864 RepID=UPI00164579D8|nr:hypothetical protein [Synechococcus sp. BIOS-E4-1]QNI54961.1 hypothetical protein SynBIOSE41_02462 [Synechococcus sp. BIOS-E4-1]
MNDKHLYKELQLRTGSQAVQELVTHLSDVLNKDPSFAIAATVDSMRALDALLTQHTNADRSSIDMACAVFITALTNASTLGSAKLVHCNPDEQIVDYTNHDDYLME